MEISNKSLAVLLVIAVVVSVGGAVMNMARLTELASIVPKAKGVTGFGTTGVVNVSLQSAANLNVTQTFIDFGVGSVTAPQPGALLITDRYSENWTNYGGFTPDPLALENIGNVNLSVSVVSDKNALNYLSGGTGPSFQFNVTNKDPNSCTGTLAGTYTEIYEAAALSNNTQNICSEMRFNEATNELYFNVRLYVPYNVPVGNKTAIITFNVTEI